MDAAYLDYYRPLVQEFVAKVSHLDHPNAEKMPQPHFPLFGTGYAEAKLRLVVIGQDTKWWGDLLKFIEGEREKPGFWLNEGLKEFRTRTFTGWGHSRQHFFGFVMMLLAALNGREDWWLMKQGGMQDILDGFAWANANAVELYGSTQSKRKDRAVPADYWEAVGSAAKPLNRFRHIVQTLRPHVAIILYRGLNPDTYFKGCNWLEVPGARDGRLTQYRLPDDGVDIIHAPHPASMNRIEGADHFLTRMRDILSARGSAKAFECVQKQSVTASTAPDLFASLPELQSLPEIGAGLDKFEFVARTAELLWEKQAFMAVPALAALVNRKGGRTNYGTEYDGGRGSYRLVSGTYHRAKNAGLADRAHKIAVAFRRPNFEYAYGDD